MKLCVIWSGFLYLQLILGICKALVVILQHPANDTYCEGTDAKLSCIIFDNTTATVADSTAWINAETLVLVAAEMISSTRDDDVVTSVLTIENLSLSNDNGTQYFFSPRRDVDSFVGVISVAVPPMTSPNITAIAQLSSTSFTIRWTITCPDNNYVITWTSLRTGVMDNMTVAKNTNSYTVTGLSGIDNYDVTVTANNSCGMMMSDPITVYDPPQTAPMIIVCREMDITNESFVLQWDAVNDVFPVTYTVRWYRGNDLIGMDSVDGLSYTVTGLTVNTSYNVTVVAVNTCCGTGPVSGVIIVTTNSKPPTIPPTATTIAITKAATTTATPTLGGLESCSNSSSLSTGAAVAIGCVVTFVVTLIVTAIITFVMTYICVEKKFRSVTQHPSSEQPKSIANAIVYDTVGPPNQTSNKGGLEMQPNPAYGTSHKVIMGVNPAYASCK